MRINDNFHLRITVSLKPKSNLSSLIKVRGMSAWVHGKHTVCHYVFIRRFLAPAAFSYFIFSFREVFSSSCLLAAPSARLHLPNTVKNKERNQLQTWIKIIRPVCVFQQGNFQSNQTLSCAAVMWSSRMRYCCVNDALSSWTYSSKTKLIQARVKADKISQLLFSQAKQTLWSWTEPHVIRTWA